MYRPKLQTDFYSIITNVSLARQPEHSFFRITVNVNRRAVPELEIAELMPS